MAENNISELKESWDNISTKYCTDKTLTEELFSELIKLYSTSGRYYHNLSHINALLKLSDEYAEKITNPDYVYFSIWYHDAIYNTLKSNNEEQSSKLAIKRLTKLGLPENLIDKISKIILATKTHIIDSPEIADFDSKFILDIDLSILGTNWNIYQDYIKNIRSEYKIYPDFLYNNGRIKVLNHFLKLSNIYKTELLQEHFEHQARSNLKQEIILLS